MVAKERYEVLRKVREGGRSSVLWLNPAPKERCKREGGRKLRGRLNLCRNLRWVRV
jgi:hypothetical protein